MPLRLKFTTKAALWLTDISLLGPLSSPCTHRSLRHLWNLNFTAHIWHALHTSCNYSCICYFSIGGITVPLSTSLFKCKFSTVMKRPHVSNTQVTCLAVTFFNMIGELWKLFHMKSCNLLLNVEPVTWRMQECIWSWEQNRSFNFRRHYNIRNSN